MQVTVRVQINRIWISTADDCSHSIKLALTIEFVASTSIVGTAKNNDQLPSLVNKPPHAHQYCS